MLEAAQRATGLTPGKARALLGRFLFSGEEAEKPLAGLSGGERRRLSLAILVHSGANVLILDEPTNHLDIESREALEDALRAFAGAILLVSHDRALLDAVGTRTVAVEERALHSYLGGWAEYARGRGRSAARDAAARTDELVPALAAQGAGGRGRRRATRCPPRRRGEGEGAVEEPAERAAEGRAGGRGGRGGAGGARRGAGRPGGLGDALRGGQVRGPPHGRPARGRGRLRAARGARRLI